MSDFHFIYEKSYGCEINISSIQAKYMTMNANTNVRNIGTDFTSRPMDFYNLNNRKQTHKLKQQLSQIKRSLYFLFIQPP